MVEFARQVWPGVRQERPELIFTIVGRNPAARVRELASIPGVEVTGTVSDVRPFYQQAVAAIVPLRVGGGSRLKILEAMAASVPVVSTRLGAEGLDVNDHENILIADTSEELQRAILSMAGNQSLRDRIAAGGQALVSDHYDWSQLGANLIEIYQQLLVERREHSGI